MTEGLLTLAALMLLLVIARHSVALSVGRGGSRLLISILYYTAVAVIITVAGVSK